MKDNSLCIVTGSGTDKTAALDGFTITAGYAGLESAGTAPTSRGAGLMVEAGSPTVLNCRFTGHYALGDTGTVMAYNGSNPILNDCEFLNNEGIGRLLHGQQQPHPDPLPV